MKPIVTLSALNAIMTYCGHHAVEAAALIVAYQQDPINAQVKAKDLARRVIAAGDIGSMPVDMIRGMALWATMPSTVVTVTSQPRAANSCSQNTSSAVLKPRITETALPCSRSRRANI